MNAPGMRREPAILITGASSGIGYATALRLARRGAVVFAGIRRQVDGETLVRESGGRVRPILLDVTDSNSLRAALAHFESRREFRFEALVNNAGYALAGPLELLPDEELRRQFDVNFFGPLELVRAFLPLLREHGGRIVNVSSIGGKLALPLAGAYAASKFALEAASDALRVELRPLGVSVSVIEPGQVRTPIWRRSADASLRILDRAPAAGRTAYEPMIRASLALVQRAEPGGIPPERVARAIERALFARVPKARYLVGPDARLRLALARLPEAVRDSLVLRALGKRPAAKRMPAAKQNLQPR
jgi:NAD(P)-dependent dehydrogenase (short-subunit alcohol dehydrogenase family)